MRVTNCIPLGCSLVLPVDTANCVQTLKATNVDVFVAETTPPQLNTAELSLTTETLTLEFSETVSAGSVVATKISLQVTLQSGTVVSQTFSVITPQQNDADVIVLTLDTADLNIIKETENLCVSPHSACAIVVTQGAFLDMSNNPLDSNTVSVRCTFSDRNLHSRMPLVFHAFAPPLEALPCV
jgi:hypothetical protein